MTTENQRERFARRAQEHWLKYPDLDRDMAKVQHYVDRLFRIHVTELDAFLWLTVFGDVDKVLGALDSVRSVTHSQLTYSKLNAYVQMRRPSVREGQVWLERSLHHLFLLKRELLDASDEQGYRGCEMAISTLTGLVHDTKSVSCLNRRAKRVVEIQHNKVHESPSVGGLHTGPMSKRKAAIDEMRDEWHEAAQNFYREAA